MRRARFGLLLSALILTALPSFGYAQPDASDEQALKKAGLATDPAAVLDFIKKRTPSPAAADQLREWIKQLDDKNPVVHGKAAADLVSLGTAAVPALRRAANDFDRPDAAGRARACLQNIEGSAGTSVVSAAIRILGQVRPSGSVPALLAYAPFADNDQVLEEIGKALAVGGGQEGKIDPALILALEDQIPIRRALAGEVLSKSANPKPKKRFAPCSGTPSLRFVCGPPWRWPRLATPRPLPSSSASLPSCLRCSRGR